MSAVFVTATGTGVGKTWLMQRLIEHCRRTGRPVDAIKPVISGFDPHDWSDSDTGLLLRALQRPASADALARTSPWRLRAPLSPDMAAAREGRAIAYDDLLAFCRRRIAQADGLLLIEGVGGAMVPLDDRHTVLDWIGALGVPAVVVGASSLGTISHCLTALQALESRGIDVRALVICESATAPVTTAETAATLSRFTTVRIHPLARVPLPQDDRVLHAPLEALVTGLVD